jgi:hypothetical protein
MVESTTMDFACTNRPKETHTVDYGWKQCHDDAPSFEEGKRPW